ncbi:hypothetical protein IU474_16740 [Nocardia otitidiscaviarum]|uniref:hypothetical protein n=1 Tax=Nocardia otitidiscaviarum TaxID=1823 RepID=UPI0018934A9C|nr:hypothetical protein [Nocardia otitidiscaviarum]MBF6238698.1 hypothetical protein [Nocardia otitidiscaviarum]
MTESQPRRRRPAAPSIPIPTSVWNAGPTPLATTGYGPLPLLSRAVREFLRPKGFFLLAALTPQQEALAPRVLAPLFTELCQYLPRRGGKATASPLALPSANDPADLIVASLLPPMPTPCDTDTLARMTFGAAEKLRPGGILTVLSQHSHDRNGRLIDPTGPLVNAAQSADLLYLSHIVAAPLLGDTIAAEAATETTGHHLRAHLDLSVFLNPDHGHPATALGQAA